MKTKERPGARSERRIRQFGSVAASRVEDCKRLAAREGREYIPQAERFARAKLKEERRQAVRDAKVDWRLWRNSPAVKAWFKARNNESVKASYQRNKERRKAATRSRYHRNVESERQRVKVYKHSNPEKASHWGQRRYALANLYSDGTLTREVVQRLFDEARSCIYCGREFDEGSKTLDHMIALSLGGPHSLRNAVICCKTCNRSKSARPFSEWLTMLKIRNRAKAERLYRQRLGSTEQMTLTLPYASIKHLGPPSAT